MSLVAELHVAVARLEDELEFAPWALTKVNDAHAGETQITKIVSDRRRYFTLNSLRAKPLNHSVAEPQQNTNIHHRDTEARRHGEELGGKQSQKQEQKQNPRTAEDTEKIQGRMEIDENLRDKQDSAG